MRAKQKFASADKYHKYFTLDILYIYVQYTCRARFFRTFRIPCKRVTKIRGLFTSSKLINDTAYSL